MIGLPPTLNRGLGTSKDKGLNRVPVQKKKDNETIDQIDTSTLESSLVPPPRN